MYALLALSASWFMWRHQKNGQALVYQYRGIAYAGLRQAVGVLSTDNCDAVLATLILLSWQATEWYDIEVSKMLYFADTLVGRNGLL